ncbi:hypothetical protein RFI_17571, partial [Reticulomyxa filosa]
MLKQLKETEEKEVSFRWGTGTKEIRRMDQKTGMVADESSLYYISKKKKKKKKLHLSFLYIVVYNYFNTFNLLSELTVFKQVWDTASPVQTCSKCVSLEKDVKKLTTELRPTYNLLSVVLQELNGLRFRVAGLEEKTAEAEKNRALLSPPNEVDSKSRNSIKNNYPSIGIAEPKQAKKWLTFDFVIPFPIWGVQDIKHACNRACNCAAAKARRAIRTGRHWVIRRKNKQDIGISLQNNINGKWNSVINTWDEYLMSR